MLAFFGMHGAEIALRTPAPPFLMPVQPAFGRSPDGLSFPASLPAAERVFWWLHALDLPGVFGKLPPLTASTCTSLKRRSRTAFCRSFEPVATVPRETFAGGKRVRRARRWTGSTWKGPSRLHLLHRVRKVQRQLPRHPVGQDVEPRFVIQDGKHNLSTTGKNFLRAGGRDARTPDRRIGRKSRNRRRGVDLGLHDLRRLHGQLPGFHRGTCPRSSRCAPSGAELRRFPSELAGLLSGAVEQRSNPGDHPRRPGQVGERPGDPVLSSACPWNTFSTWLRRGLSDARNKKVTLAVVKALKAAGVSFASWGREELCCGDSLRRLGNEFIFEKMARQNVELFKKYSVKKILTYCPHCYTTLKNDYAQFGLEALVIHTPNFSTTSSRRGA